MHLTAFIGRGSLTIAALAALFTGALHPIAAQQSSHLTLQDILAL